MFGLPTMFAVGKLRFMAFSNDFDEPPHVHAIHGNSSGASVAKFWLNPIKLNKNRGYNRAELRRIQSIIEEQHDFLMEQWNAFKARR